MFPSCMIFLLSRELPLVILLEHFSWQQIIFISFSSGKVFISFHSIRIFLMDIELYVDSYFLSALKKGVSFSSGFCSFWWEIHNYLNHCSSKVLFLLDAFKIFFLIFSFLSLFLMFVGMDCFYFVPIWSLVYFLNL